MGDPACQGRSHISNRRGGTADALAGKRYRAHPLGQEDAADQLEIVEIDGALDVEPMILAELV
jgi:hypothetical protein